MSKAILISIKPKWVAKILNGEKTIELRKTAPNCALPIDVYIYSTKEQDIARIFKISRDRFVCEKDFDIKDFPQMSSGYSAKGKIVAKFKLKNIYLAKYQKEKDKNTQRANELTCLTDEEIDKYLDGKDGYGWEIDDLEIYDKPKELSELKYPRSRLGIPRWEVANGNFVEKRIKKAPQSWCFVEDEQND